MYFVNKKTVAECIGTFWLVLGGCGAAVFAGSQIGSTGIALAFGLAVLTGAYAFGHLSGGHFNPAVTLGLWASGRFSARNIPAYIIAQTVGATLAVLFIWALQKDCCNIAEYSFAANGYSEFSPGKYGFAACAAAETVLTFIFLMVVCGATDQRAPGGFGPAAIGLCLTLIHLIGIPITNLSVNPARSFGPAFMQLLTVNSNAMEQVWFFILFPLIGGIAGGFLYQKFFSAD